MLGRFPLYASQWLRDKALAGIMAKEDKRFFDYIKRIMNEQEKH